LLRRIAKREILELLHQVDDRLYSEKSIILCGAAAIKLQDFPFRETSDIDFTVFPDKELRDVLYEVVVDHDHEPTVIDLQAAGVIALLEDYEDRLVQIKDNFKHLSVFVLSLIDWAVSKLQSPKLDDLWMSGLITVKHCEEIEPHMSRYCGLNAEAALRDLLYVKERLKEMEESKRA